MQGNVRGGVCDKNGEYISESAQYVRDYFIEGSYPLNDKIPYIDEEVVFLGAFSEHWGHFLMDMLVRAWYICDDTPRNIVYIKYGETMEHLKGTYWELFSILGVREEQLYEIDEPTRFRSVIIPDVSFCNGKYVTKYFIDTFDYIKNQVQLRHRIYDKVYFARTKAGLCIGEKDIIRDFKRQGYKIVYPLKLSLHEQIWYWKNCKSAVVSSGSMAHNIVFAQDQINLTIINVDRLNQYQIALNQIRNAEVSYIDCKLNLLPYMMPRFTFPTAHYINYMKNTFNYEVKIKRIKECNKMKNLFIQWLMLFDARENTYPEYVIKTFDKRWKTNIGEYYLESRRENLYWDRIEQWLKIKQWILYNDISKIPYYTVRKVFRYIKKKIQL